jgi:hypothetical protein
VNIRPWLAAAVSVAAVTLGVSSGASASTTTAHQAITHPVPHAPQIKGFHLARNVHLPRTTLQHLTPANTVPSGNWSGYTAVGDKNVALRYVGADFNVPSLNCANTPVGSAGDPIEGQWVGLDGYDTSTVEQTGIAGYCDSGTAEYYAWYEMYPSETVVYSGAISAGDAITASVYYNAGGGFYNIVLTDVTAGGQINVDATCPSGSTCKDASAEVITELPGGGPANGYNLPDFGMDNFTGTGVTSRDGVHGGLSASSLWTSTEIILEDQNGRHMIQPSSLYGGQAFNSTWLSAT